MCGYVISTPQSKAASAYCCPTSQRVGPSGEDARLDRSSFSFFLFFRPDVFLEMRAVDSPRYQQHTAQSECPLLTKYVHSPHLIYFNSPALSLFLSLVSRAALTPASFRAVIFSGFSDKSPASRCHSSSRRNECRFFKR